MSIFWIFLIVLSAAGIAIMDWKKGLFLIIPIALIQDPLRKLTPDQPVFFVILVGIVFGASVAGGVLRRIPIKLNPIPRWTKEMRAPTLLFLFVLLMQALIALVLYGNPMLPAIGMLFYLSPGLALIMGYHFAARKGLTGLERWLKIYLILSLFFLASVYLQYAGLDWPVLGEVGAGVIIYDQGTTLTAHSGLFRSSEIAAWHAATAASFLFLIATERRITFGRLVFFGLLAAFLVSIGILTGRRKMLVQISIFLFAYFGIFLLLAKHRGRLAAAVLLMGLLAFLSAVGLLGPDIGDSEYRKERYLLYVDRGRSVVDDIPERFTNLGLAPVQWALNRYGLLGAGLGTGSQGAQYFGGGGEVFGGAAEGGLGKLTMELGIPGLMIAGWLIFRLFRLLWQGMRAVANSSDRHSRMSYGCMAFLVSNIAAFVVATQAFGDLFIQIFLGMTVGFLLAMPEIAEREKVNAAFIYGEAGKASRPIVSGAMQKPGIR